MNTAVPATLVLGWGNLSRGDDALGPRCVAALRAALPAHLEQHVEFMDDYQLQVEFALDLVGRTRVLFVDASVNCAAPFMTRQALPRRDSSFSSHSLSPEALLQVFVDMQEHNPPSATVLEIRGESFELGESMTAAAESNLEGATAWALSWILMAAQAGISPNNTPHASP